MDQTTVHNLFRQFAAPLAAYAATSPARRELADMLARNLWTALIAGPEMEEEAWHVLRETGGLDHDSLEAIQQTYYDLMKPTVSDDEQLRALRQRYPLKRKVEADDSRLA